LLQKFRSDAREMNYSPERGKPIKKIIDNGVLRIKVLCLTSGCANKLKYSDYFEQINIDTVF
jgi:hypothetical protein